MISVIIPVYNVSAFLVRCLDSVLGQTYQALEIILVDDGSTDESPNICDEYEARDHRVRVIHQENAGLSGARNAGLEIATGTYIAFVDSDDFIHPAMYESLLQALQQTGADMAVSGIVKVNETDCKDLTFPPLPSGELPVVSFHTREDILAQLQERDAQTVVAWSKLYKKELFEKTRFPQGRLHEDAAVIHKILWQCQIVCYVDMEFYYYVQRGSSIMCSALESEKGIRDGIAAYRDRIDFFTEQGAESYALKAKQMMFENLQYKFSLLTQNGYNDKCAWLGNEVKTLTETYGSEDLSQDVLLLSRNPQAYYKGCRRREKIGAVKTVMKRILRWHS